MVNPQMFLTLIHIQTKFKVAHLLTHLPAPKAYGQKYSLENRFGTT